MKPMEENMTKSGVLVVMDIHKTTYNAHPDATMQDFCAIANGEGSARDQRTVLYYLISAEWTPTELMGELLGASHDGNAITPRVNIILGYYPDMDIDDDRVELAKLDIALTKEYGVSGWVS